MDSQYQKSEYKLSIREHRYGKGVYLLNDPYLLTQLTRVCSPKCTQPEINRLIKEMYRALGKIVANQEFPKAMTESPTRMADQHPKEGVFAGELLDPNASVVLVDLARAGILPAMELFDLFSSTLPNKLIRADHVFINRTIDQKKHVTGASIYGSKIGGTIEGAHVIIPDPMGATGNSVCNVIDHYKKVVGGKAVKWITLNLIVAPEYIRRIKLAHPETLIYTLRLDRGFSSQKALAGLPGEYPEEEKGLNEHDYIVPGGGGFGEISNNSFV